MEIVKSAKTTRFEGETMSMINMHGWAMGDNRPFHLSNTAVKILYSHIYL